MEKRSYLSIIDLACAEQSIQRVIPWDDKSSDVDQELASNVEEYEEEVHCGQPQKGVHFGDRCLFLKIVEDGILGELQEDPTG